MCDKPFGSVELLNLLNLLWMKPHMVPKLVMWQKQDWLSYGTEVSLSAWFLLHFEYFFDLWKWLAFRQGAVHHGQLFVTIQNKQWTWLWTISHWMHLLLTVTVVQFEMFVVDFIVSPTTSLFPHCLSPLSPTCASASKSSLYIYICVRVCVCVGGGGGGGGS